MPLTFAIPLSLDTDFLGIWFPEIPEKFGYKECGVNFFLIESAPNITIKDKILTANLIRKCLIFN
jgi:hypothetical protein